MYRHGGDDAQTYMDENPGADWKAARTCADDALINALGVEKALRAIGFTGRIWDSTAALTDDAHDAFSEYNRGWAAAIDSALAQVSQ